VSIKNPEIFISSASGDSLPAGQDTFAGQIPVQLPPGITEE
jgi:hypothetical protein